jgi:hypothetical protein
VSTPVPIPVPVTAVGAGLEALAQFLQLLNTPAGQAVANRLLVDNIPQDKLDAAVAAMKDAPPPKS